MNAGMPTHNPKPKTTAERVAKVRRLRSERGLCIRCGKPALHRVIYDAFGAEVERKVLKVCRECR